MEASFFAGNRRRLLQNLKPGSLVALAGFGDMQRDNDQPFAFQQDGNFWYLTGIEEPNWRLLIDVDSGDEWLIAPQLNKYHATFDGGMTSEKASKTTGVVKVTTPREGKDILQKLLSKKKQVYAIAPQSTRIYGFQQNVAPRKLYGELKNIERIDLRLPLAKLRAIKQPAEIAAIQEAVNITADGIVALTKELKDYTHEYEVDAKLYYEFRRRGATHGFDPIVASGHKTCILHAPAGNDPLHDWLLVDVGAKKNGYTADITRTIPLKPPTERQIKIYKAVQLTHDYFLSIIKPGAATAAVLNKAYTFMGEQMVELGLIKKPLLNRDNVFRFMPHAISHGLGVDVHDSLGRAEVFAENMVLTNEAGIYLPNEGFGVRIENDMVITKDGARDMAANLPISLAELSKMVY